VNHLAAVPSRAHLVSAATRADRGPHRLPGGTSLLGLESDKNWPGVAELIVAVYPKRSEVSRMRIARNGSKAGPAPCRCHSAGLDDPAVNQVVWVYAVAADLDPGRLSGLTGVGGEPVRAVAEGDLCAVVGSVDAAVFGEKSLASLLADQTNIEMIGRAHHQVVAGVASDGPVVPLRLATIYPDDLTVRVLLAERLTELAVMLESFRGTEEWGVKVHVEPWTDGGDGDPGAVSSSDPDGTPVRGRAGRKQRTTPRRSTERSATSPSRPGGTPRRTRASATSRDGRCTAASTCSTPSAPPNSPGSCGS
jgi:hypothetical protein